MVYINDCGHDRNDGKALQHLQVAFLYFRGEPFGQDAYRVLVAFLSADLLDIPDGMGSGETYPPTLVLWFGPSLSTHGHLFVAYGLVTALQGYYMGNLTYTRRPYAIKDLLLVVSIYMASFLIYLPMMYSLLFVPKDI